MRTTSGFNMRLPETAQLVEQLDHRGYIIVPNWIDETEVARQRQAMMDAMKDDESSSDDEAWDIEERPACVENMHFDLRALMTTQFDEFMLHLVDAIEISRSIPISLPS